MYYLIIITKYNHNHNRHRRNHHRRRRNHQNSYDFHAELYVKRKVKEYERRQFLPLNPNYLKKHREEVSRWDLSCRPDSIRFDPHEE